MKQLTFSLSLLLLSMLSLKAQITLEHTYTGVSAAYIHLPTAGYKYYVMDVANSQCRLYNNDHSLWKTINLSVPSNYYLYDIQFVSEDLFNSDNLIEFLYVSYNYNATLDYYTYDTRIANENGSILLSVPGGGYSGIYKAETGSKLFVWVYNYAVTPYAVNTQVYKIPGQYNTAINEYEQSDVALRNRAFPNPTSGDITIEFSLPATINKAELKVFTLAGTEVKSFVIDHSFNSLLINTADMAAGIYLYRIESEQFKSESKRISVTK